MAEQTEQIESPLLWQELTPEEASQAVFGGYSHFVNNRLVPLSNVQFHDLNSEQLEKHRNLVASFHTNDLDFEEIFLGLHQKTAEEAVRLTAQRLKKKIEGKVREKLDSPDNDNPAQLWFRQAENFYSLEKFSEDRKIMEKVLRDIKVIWENLEALADPEKQIKPDAKLNTDGEIIFNFREQLTLPH